MRWFDKQRGYGFIEVPGNGDAFVHFSDIKEDFRGLKTGEKVEFEVFQGPRSLVAKNVRKIKGPL